MSLLGVGRLFSFKLHTEEVCLSPISERWAFRASLHTLRPQHTPYISQFCVPQKETEIQQQRASYQLEKLYQFLEQQEQLFVAWLQELGQTIGKVRETHDTQVSRDIALLDKLIGELEAKKDLPEWKLMQVSVSVPSLCLPVVPSGII